MGGFVFKRRSKKVFKKLKRQRLSPVDCQEMGWDDREFQALEKKDCSSSSVPRPPINICSEQTDRIHIKVDCTRTMQLNKLLKDRDIEYEVKGISSNVSTTIKLRSPVSTLPLLQKSLYKQNSIDWNDYYPLQNIYEFMDGLEKDFPSICSVSSIGTTVEGREIKMLKISNSNSKNTGVWIDGTIHAREWISTCVVTYIANYITQNFYKLKEGVTNKDWYLVPVLNPDGYVYSHTSDRMWRKNRSRTLKGDAIVGVDLNRNFGLCWAQENQEYSSVDPSHNNYHGPQAFSEPETSAVKDVILYSGIPFKVFLSLHAYSEVIAFPWCFTADPCPDYVDLLEGGTIMSKAIYKTTGKMYKVGNFLDVMYSACGTSVDWSYGVAKIPFSYLVELRGKNHKFLLPKTEIKDTCEETLNAVLSLVKFVDTKKCSNYSILLSDNRK